MTVTVSELVERVRLTLQDYGEAAYTLASGVDADDTEFLLNDVSGLSVGATLDVGFEACTVTSVPEGAPYSVGVRRGQRGSQTAAHSAGATVYAEPRFSSYHILRCLNVALGKLTKQVRDQTLSVAQDTYVYDVPETIGTLHRVEMESVRRSGFYYPIGDWDQPEPGKVRIWGSYTSGLGIALVGTASFAEFGTDGTLDAELPLDNGNVVNFLVYDTAGQMLLARQGRIASRDTFEGVTDPFAQTQPDQSARIALQYLALAERYRRKASMQCPILRVPSRVATTSADFAMY